MSDALTQAFQQADSFRQDCYRRAGVAVKAEASGRSAMAAAAFSSGGMAGVTGGFNDESRKAAQGYRAYRDIPFAAIRPIAVAIANRSVHVGRKRRKNEQAPLRTKQYSDLVLNSAPQFVQK